MFRNHCKQASHFLFSVLYSPRWNGSEHFKGKLLASVICTMLVVQTSIDIYRPFLSKYIHIVYCKCMQRSCIYLFIFSRTCVHILAVRHNTIDFFITFPSLFIKKKNGQRCLQYNSYFTYSYIFTLYICFCVLISFI